VLRAFEVDVGDRADERPRTYSGIIVRRWTTMQVLQHALR
jgi:hypothetical protein